MKAYLGAALLANDSCELRTGVAQADWRIPSFAVASCLAGNLAAAGALLRYDLRDLASGFLSLLDAVLVRTLLVRVPAKILVSDVLAQDVLLGLPAVFRSSVSLTA